MDVDEFTKAEQKCNICTLNISHADTHTRAPVEYLYDLSETLDRIYIVYIVIIAIYFQS